MHTRHILIDSHKFSAKYLQTILLNCINIMRIPILVAFLLSLKAAQSNTCRKLPAQLMYNWLINYLINKLVGYVSYSLCLNMFQARRRIKYLHMRMWRPFIWTLMPVSCELLESNAHWWHLNLCPAHYRNRSNATVGTGIHEIRGLADDELVTDTNTFADNNRLRRQLALKFAIIFLCITFFALVFVALFIRYYWFSSSCLCYR